MSSNRSVYYKQNRLKQLRAFCAAVDTGSITEAAEQLFLSQPSVSLQIQALERELDVTVFERRGPRIRLTPEGEVLYKLANPLVQGIDRLHETFAAHCGNLETGDLHIAAGETAILYLLPDPLKRFAEDYPGISVHLDNATGPEALGLVRADKVDFAVGAVLDQPADIEFQPIVSYQPTLIAPLGHALGAREHPSLDEIAAHGLILPPPNYTTSRVVDSVFRRHGLVPKVALEAGGWEIIKKYVEIGLGVSIVTDVCLTGEERLVRRPLDRHFPQRTYGIVMRRGKYLSPQAARFIDMLNEHFQGRGVGKRAAVTTASA
jgi:DNA-binding transcriptional LysR family regulator